MDSTTVLMIVIGLTIVAALVLWYGRSQRTARETRQTHVHATAPPEAQPELSRTVKTWDTPESSTISARNTPDTTSASRNAPANEGAPGMIEDGFELTEDRPHITDAEDRRMPPLKESIPSTITGPETENAPMATSVPDKESPAEARSIPDRGSIPGAAGSKPETQKPEVQKPEAQKPGRRPA